MNVAKPSSTGSETINDPHAESGDARLDKWLWAVRAFKTRALATAACRAGAVTVNDREAKPARSVRSGERVMLQQGLVMRTLVVLGVPEGRLGAKRVAEFCEELTPPEEWAKARELRVQQILARDPGAGRPTKRDRRQLDRLFQ